MVVKAFIILTGMNESWSLHVLLVTAAYHQIKSYLRYMDCIYIVNTSCTYGCVFTKSMLFWFLSHCFNFKFYWLSYNH